MVSHTKRYRLETQRWGKDWQDKSFFKIDVTECDTIEEVHEYVQMTKDIYADVIRPDAGARFKYRTKSKSRWKIPNEKDYIYDNNHFWWGYAVFDFDEHKIIMEGGEGFENEQHPMKSLRYLDLYFRGDDEIPKDYKWDNGEYQGWLQFRWGDGENAIEKVRIRKQKEAEAAECKRLKHLEELARKREEEEEEASEEDLAEYLLNPESAYDDIQDEYDRIADEQAVKYNMEKYGW